MSKRKKTKKSRSGFRRSRMSGMGAIDTTNLIGVAGGAIIAKFVDKVIPDTIDQKIVAGGKLALGIALPMFVKSGKAKDIIGGVGSGMVAVGAVDLLTSFGVLQGLGADDNEDMLVVSLDGVDDIPVINGMDDIPVINGDEDTSVLAEEVLAGMDYDDLDEY